MDGYIWINKKGPRLQIGSFFMINLCLVVIATQFSETKKREMERMRLERARYHSTSTLASSTNTSEPTTCYAEIVKWVLVVVVRPPRTLFARTGLLLVAHLPAEDSRRLCFTMDDNLMSTSRYIAHLWRRGKRRLMKRYRLWLYKRQQKREQNLLKEQQTQVSRSNAPIVGPNRVPGGNLKF